MGPLAASTPTNGPDELASPSGHPAPSDCTDWGPSTDLDKRVASHMLWLDLLHGGKALHNRPFLPVLRLLFLPFGFLTVLLVILVLLFGRYDGSVQGQGSVLMAVDADPQASGIQTCVGDVSVGTSVSVDFVIQNVSDIEGFGLRLVYDSAVVSVTAKDRSVSILGSSGFDVGETLPDTDGSYLDGYAGTTASGSGILTRYTLQAKAVGITSLHLLVGNVDTNYVDSSLLIHLPDQTQDASVSVGAPCTQPSSPTPAGPSPTPGGPSPTPVGPSPTPGGLPVTPTPAGPTPTPTPLPPGMETVVLAAGCNPVASTYPNETAITDIAGAVTPAASLVSLWKFEDGGWLGYSPDFPQVSDLAKTDFLDVVFACVNEAGLFVRRVV
jgi:hypothetical protein